MGEELTIWTAQVIDDGADGLYWSCSWRDTPRGMDTANGWAPGWYAVDANCGETGNAWAWFGPYETEAEAIEAVKADAEEALQAG